MSSSNNTTQSNVINLADAAAVMAVLNDISLHDGAESAILWQGGEIRWQGPGANRLYNAWSASKSFTSTCLGLMVDDGKLALDAPAAEYLPELKEHYSGVTLRHILTFTSGIRTRGNEGDPAIQIDPFDVVEPRYPLGKCMHYSPESEWIGLAVARAAGMPMAELFRQRVGDKIGIDYEYFDWRNFGERDGLTMNGGSGAFGAGVFTSAENLLRFGQFQLQRGAWNGEQLVSKDYLVEATSSQAIGAVPPWDALDGWYRDWLPGAYGLHFWVNGLKLNGQRLWPSAPGTTFAAQGNRNQICLVIPEWDAIIVRMGDDGVIPMHRYDEVLKRLKEAL